MLKMLPQAFGRERQQRNAKEVVVVSFEVETVRFEWEESIRRGHEEITILTKHPLCLRQYSRDVFNVFNDLDDKD